MTATAPPPTPVFKELSKVITAAGQPTLYKDFNRSNSHTQYRMTQKQNQILSLLPKCGWASRYLRISSTLGARCDWEPYYKGELIEEPIIKQCVAAIKPVNSSQQAMRAQSIYLQRLLGIHAVTLTKTDEGKPDFQVWHPTVIRQPRHLKDHQNYLGFQTDPDLTRPQDLQIINASQTARHIIPDDTYKNRGQSCLEPVLHLMKYYASHLEALIATADTRRLMSAIIHFSPKINEYITEPSLIDTGSGESSMGEVVNDMAAITSDAHGYRGKFRTMPLPMEYFGDITLHQLGEIVDKEKVEALSAITSEAATALQISSHWLLHGEGSATTWAGAEERNAVIDQTVKPDLEINDQFWSKYFRHAADSRTPRTVFDNNELARSNLDDWELRGNTNIIESKSDNSAFILELVKNGILPREAAARAVGEKVLPLPTGVTEIDHLYALQGGGQPNTDEATTIEQRGGPDSEPFTLAALRRDQTV